jgi:hypothetical protein
LKLRFQAPGVPIADLFPDQTMAKRSAVASHSPWEENWGVVTGLASDRVIVNIVAGRASADEGSKRAAKRQLKTKRCTKNLVHAVSITAKHADQAKDATILALVFCNI